MADDVGITEHMEDIKKWCKDPARLGEYEKSIREAIKQNEEDDFILETSNFVSDDMWKRIKVAANYDSATTVNWALKKLSILYDRTQLGERIFVPSINVYLERDNFEKVICTEISQFIFNEITELYGSR